MLGTVGHLFILAAFVSCAISGFAYFQAARSEDRQDWKPVGRTAWSIMMAAILGASGILWYLLFTHQFQYLYVFNTTSRDLPAYYLFSSFWAGQEGSFLLWIIFSGAIGFGMMAWGRRFEAPVMAIIAFCQIFLLSMVVGLKLGSVPIGSSPFTLLAERYPDAPMLQIPGFIPADGNGLNDLLQNYWMAIHPPTLFVGFAAMIVPFAYAVTGLWKRQYTEWVRPALPWALFANMVLMIGIAMGGYWAYETLSFGGFWAWDPVENSSLVPWIVGMAAIHMMLVQRKSGAGQKAAIILSIVAYMFVIYSTFLTRSGILGDISVHSFVDLGLNNQLLLWILAMGFIGFGLFAYRYRELPAPQKEPHLFSRESMIIAGAVLLCATAAVIILGTSSPIFGRIFRDNPSGVPIEFYNRWTLPLTVGIAFLVGLGQLFWWRKMNVDDLNRVLLKPLVLSFASTAAVLVFTPFIEEVATPAALLAQATEYPTARTAGLMGNIQGFWSIYGVGIQLLLLVFTSFFAFYGNAMVFWRVARGNLKLAGGAVTHIGFAMMIFGIITSSAFKNPIAEGRGIPTQGPDGTISEARDNFIITRGESMQIAGFQVQYTGQERTADGHTAYVLDFTDAQGRSFTARPVVYRSDNDQWIQHPDIKKYFEKDIYVAVAPSIMFEEPGAQAARPGEVRLQRGEEATIGHEDYSIRFESFDLNVDQDLLPDDFDIAVASVLHVTNLRTNETRTLRPIYVIMQDRSQQYVQNRVPDWGLTVTFAGMQVDTGSIQLIIEGVEVAPEDWLVVQAQEKPLINLLWIGLMIMFAGFGLSIYRRVHDQQEQSRLNRD